METRDKIVLPLRAGSRLRAHSLRNPGMEWPQSDHAMVAPRNAQSNRDATFRTRQRRLRGLGYRSWRVDSWGYPGAGVPAPRRYHLRARKRQIGSYYRFRRPENRFARRITR